jgi:hypothetical protein
LVYLKQWRFLAGFVSLLLLALITKVDFRSTAQADFADYSQTALTQASQPNQTGQIAGTSWQGQPGIVQTTRQIMARKQQFAARPPRPQPRLPVKTHSTPAKEPGSITFAAAAGLAPAGPDQKPA